MSFRNLHLGNKVILFLRKKDQEKLDVMKILMIIASVVVATVLILSFFIKSKTKAENIKRADVKTIGVDSQNISYETRKNIFLDLGVKNSTQKINEDKTNKTVENKNTNHFPERKVNQNNYNYEKQKRKYQTKAIIFDESGKDIEILEEGTLIPVILLSSITMKNTKSPVRFKVVEDIFDDNGNLTIPSGSIVFGTLSGFNDQGRVFGRIKRLKILGEKIKNIQADILSSDESYGLSGLYYDEKGKYLAGSLVTTFLGSFAEGFKSQILTEMGDKLTKYSAGNIKNALLNALEKTALNEAQRQALAMSETDPFVVLPHGTPALLIVGNTLEL